MPAGLRIVTSHGSLSVRPEAGGPAEEAFLYLLFASTKAPEMALMPATNRDKEFLLQVQFRSMSATYRQRFPKARFEIVELDRWPIGRIVTDVQEHCVYYVDFALLPEARSTGIGTALMSALLDEPRRLGLPARLRTLSHNFAALRLYQRLGFVKRADAPPFVELEWRAKT
jgi:GNAT superfamily N-acetyltransferase